MGWGDGPITGVEYDAWREHLVWEAEAMSGSKGIKFKGDPKVYDRWKRKVGSTATLNAMVQNAAFELKAKREKEAVERSKK